MANKLTQRLNIQDWSSQQNIQNLIAEIERYNGMWIMGANLSPQILSVLKRSAIITSTVLQILNKLLAMKKIERLGAGRSSRYKVVKQ